MICSRRARRVGGALAALLALQLLAHCSAYEPGIEVGVGIVHYDGGTSAAHPDGQPRAIASDLGYAVTLTAARVAVLDLELLPCSPRRASLRRLRGALASVAHAHGGAAAGPTELHVEHVFDMLVAERQLVELGLITPPPDDYCGAMIRLGAVAGEPTLLLQGRYRRGDGPATRFSVAIEGVAVAGVALSDHEGPMSLSEQRRDGQIAIGIDYTEWFDGVDLDAVDAAERDDLVLANVIGSFRHGPPTF